MVTLFATVVGAVIGSDSIPGMLGVYFDFYTSDDINKPGSDPTHHSRIPIVEFVKEVG